MYARRYRPSRHAECPAVRPARRVCVSRRRQHRRPCLSGSFGIRDKPLFHRPRHKRRNIRPRRPGRGARNILRHGPGAGRHEHRLRHDRRGWRYQPCAPHQCNVAADRYRRRGAPGHLRHRHHRYAGHSSARWHCRHGRRDTPGRSGEQRRAYRNAKRGQSRADTRRDRAYPERYPRHPAREGRQPRRFTHTAR